MQPDDVKGSSETETKKIISDQYGILDIILFLLEMCVLNSALYSYYRLKLF